jgi:hypothetical protein
LLTSNTVPICQKGNSDIDSIIIIIIIKYPNAEYIILPDFRSVVMHQQLCLIFVTM